MGEKEVVKCIICGKKLETEQEINYKICKQCAWKENV